RGPAVGGLAVALRGGGAAPARRPARVPPEPMFGPVDLAGAWAETERALAHGAIVFAAVLALAHWAPRRPRAAGALALLLLAADLAVANARLIRTVPKADLEAPPEAARLIEAAERSDPSPGPFRLHRLPGRWFPAQFADTQSSRRYPELFAWARETLFPLFALPLGFEYCTTIGSLELEDYVAFFHPQPMPVPPAVAQVLGVPPGQPVA